MTNQFRVGDSVNVLNPFRLPRVEEVKGTGVIERISESNGETLYWISGFKCARTARVLRPVVIHPDYDYASSETAYGRTVNYGFAVKVF